MNQEKGVFFLGVFLVIMTFACCFAYIHKKNTLVSPNTNNVSDISNWNLNDGWKKESIPQPITPNNQPDVIKSQIMTNTYKEALAVSSREGRPILIFYTASWCTWCQKMKQETLSDNQVSDLMKNYIYLVVDVDQDRETTNKFDVKEIPAFVITNAKEEKLKFHNRFMIASDFATWLNNPEMFNQPKVETNPIPPESLPKDTPKDMRKIIPLRRI